MNKEEIKEAVLTNIRLGKADWFFEEILDMLNDAIDFTQEETARRIFDDLERLPICEIMGATITFPSIKGYEELKNK